MLPQEHFYYQFIYILLVNLFIKQFFIDLKYIFMATVDIKLLITTTFNFKKKFCKKKKNWKKRSF